MERIVSYKAIHSCDESSKGRIGRKVKAKETIRDQQCEEPKLKRYCSYSTFPLICKNMFSPFYSVPLGTLGFELPKIENRVAYLIILQEIANSQNFFQ